MVSRLAIVAGNGQFPLETAKKARALGHPISIVAFVTETSPEIAQYADSVDWIKIGQLSKLLGSLKKHRAEEVIFTGGISRVRIFRNAIPDLKGLALIARVGSIRDDVFLRGVAEEVEKLGMKVIPSGAILTESVAKAGYLSKRRLTAGEAKDALYGWDAAKTLGALDIGQTAVVSNGMIVALECIEGTDRAIVRAGDLVHKRPSLVVKTAKPQQDLRLDLPSVGIGTLETMHQAGARVLILEHERAMVLAPGEFVDRANALNMSVYVVKERSELESMQSNAD